MITFSGYPEISRNSLSGRVELNDFTMSLKWSTIGNFHLHLLEVHTGSIFNFIMEMNIGNLEQRKGLHSVISQFLLNYKNVSDGITL